MKATLEFDLPDEDYDFKCACQAGEMYQTLRDTDNEMRNLLKHVDMDKQTRDWLEQWRQQINEAIQGIEV